MQGQAQHQWPRQVVHQPGAGFVEARHAVVTGPFPRSQGIFSVWRSAEVQPYGHLNVRQAGTVLLQRRKDMLDRRFGVRRTDDGDGGRAPLPGVGESLLQSQQFACLVGEDDTQTETLGPLDVEPHLLPDLVGVHRRAQAGWGR